MQRIILILILAAVAHAQKVVAVLEIIPNNENVELHLSEYRHLTDELRTRAREALPQTGYSILTRDNIISLLPTDEEARECLAESCAVEIGRAIGAEYITQGFIGKFGEMMTLTVELYESMSGNLLGSFVTESKDIMGLLATIRQKAPGLFANLPEQKSLSEPRLTGLKDLQDEKKKGAASQKSSASFYIALGLDILGAAALGYGIYQHINSNSLYDDYKKLPNNDKSTLQKANDAQQMRNVWLTVGGGLLATGIAVHIWF